MPYFLFHSFLLRITESALLRTLQGRGKQVTEISHKALPNDSKTGCDITSANLSFFSAILIVIPHKILCQSTLNQKDVDPSNRLDYRHLSIWIINSPQFLWLEVDFLSVERPKTAENIWLMSYSHQVKFYWTFLFVISVKQAFILWTLMSNLIKNK